MNRNPLPTVLIAALALGGLLFAPRAPAAGTLYTDAQMTNVQWVPAAGALNWSSPWELAAAASVFDSQNGFTNAYQSQIGQPATVAASAATPLIAVASQAQVDAAGNIVSLESSLSETVLPGVALEAFSAATAYREFEITGGSGPVAVTFSFDYSGLCQSTPDAVSAGYRSDFLAGLRISDGVNQWDLTTSAILGDSAYQPFGGTLSQSFTLEYDKPYSISLVKDLEVPEPNVNMCLLAFGATLGAHWLARKARGHRNKRLRRTHKPSEAQ